MGESGAAMFPDSGGNLRLFADKVRSIATDPEAESFVRGMLSRIAKSCPLEVLARLGECLVECRRDEIRDESQLN